MIPQESEIDRVFALQKQHFPELRKTTAKQRIEKLQLLHASILRERKKLEEAVYADLRKPVHEAGLTEIYIVTSEIKHACKNLRTWMRPVVVKNPLTFLGARGEIRYEPKGLTLILSPWNYPFQLAVAPLVSAIAAGNCAIVKPSEISAHTSSFIRELISNIFPEREIAVFEGHPSVAAELLQKPFHHIFFTGSPAVGKLVMKAAADHHASVTLEMGGKCPTILDDHFPVEEAARKITWGKFLNAGQTCLAPDYVLVPRNRIDKLVENIKKTLSEFYGDLHRNDYCKIINSKHELRIRNLLEDAKQKGANVEVWDFESEKNLIAPAILTNVAPDSRILQEEIFGPLLPLIAYDSLEDALSFMNSRSRPLALYIFSRQNEFLKSVLEATTSGSVCVNETVVQFGNLSLPFGGVNTSGIGNSHGYYGFKAFSHERSVLHQPQIGMMTFLYPPYTNRIKKLIDWTIRYF